MMFHGESAAPVHEVDVAQELAELERKMATCTELAQIRALLGTELAGLLPVRDRCSIVFLEPAGEWLRIHRILPVTDPGPGPLPRVRVDGTPVGRVVLEGLGRVVSDVRTDPNITFGHASHDGIRATVSVPIRIGTRVVGAMNVGSKTTGACTAPMLGELERIAAVIGPAFFAAEQALAQPAEPAPAQANEEFHTLAEHQRLYIEHVLAAHAGMVEGAAGAARVLGLPPSTLRSRMKRLDVRKGGTR